MGWFTSQIGVGERINIEPYACSRFPVSLCVFFFFQYLGCSGQLFHFSGRGFPVYNWRELAERFSIIRWENEQVGNTLIHWNTMQLLTYFPDSVRCFEKFTPRGCPAKEYPHLIWSFNKPALSGVLGSEFLRGHRIFVLCMCIVPSLFEPTTQISGCPFISRRVCKQYIPRLYSTS